MCSLVAALNTWVLRSLTAKGHHATMGGPVTDGIASPARALLSPRQSVKFDASCFLHSVVVKFAIPLGIVLPFTTRN